MECMTHGEEKNSVIPSKFGSDIPTSCDTSCDTNTNVTELKMERSQTRNVLPCEIHPLNGVETRPVRSPLVMAARPMAAAHGWMFSCRDYVNLPVFRFSAAAVLSL